jgi:hypothetical protein
VGAAQVIAGEMRGGGINTYAAAITPWIADRSSLIGAAITGSSWADAE